MVVIVDLAAQLILGRGFLGCLGSFVVWFCVCLFLVLDVGVGRFVLIRVVRYVPRRVFKLGSDAPLSAVGLSRF